MYSNFKYQHNDRFGFIPFVAGAITGGIGYSLINPYRPRPVYYTYPYTYYY